MQKGYRNAKVLYRPIEETHKSPIERTFSAPSQNRSTTKPRSVERITKQWTCRASKSLCAFAVAVVVAVDFAVVVVVVVEDP